MQSKKIKKREVNFLINYYHTALSLYLFFSNLYTFPESLLYKKCIYLCRTPHLCISHTNRVFYAIYHLFHFPDAKNFSCLMGVFKLIFSVFVYCYEKLLQTKPS